MPCNILSRASTPNFTSLAAHFYSPLCLMRQLLSRAAFLQATVLLDHAHDVALFRGQIFDPVELDLCA